VIKAETSSVVAPTMPGQELKTHRNMWATKKKGCCHMASGRKAGGERPPGAGREQDRLCWGRKWICPGHQDLVQHCDDATKRSSGHELGVCAVRTYRTCISRVAVALPKLYFQLNIESGMGNRCESHYRQDMRRDQKRGCERDGPRVRLGSLGPPFQA
jgi:hypothetical protein